MKRIIIASVAALLAGAIAAIAANTTFLTNAGDQVFPFGQPTNAGANGTIGDVNRGGMAPLNGNLSYSKSVPSTGFAEYFGNFQRTMMLKPSGTLDTGHVYLAAAPIDGAENCLFSTATVTTLTLHAGASTQTLNSAVTTLSANASACYTYSKSNTTWDRSR